MPRASARDAGDEEDVLALPRSLKVSELMEDELILALPLVPLHSVCPVPLPYLESSETQASTHIIADSLAAAADKPNPFAVLAQLKNSNASKLFGKPVKSLDTKLITKGIEWPWRKTKGYSKNSKE